jgi:hypothetical protein
MSGQACCGLMAVTSRLLLAELRLPMLRLPMLRLPILSLPMLSLLVSSGFRDSSGKRREWIRNPAI